MTPFPAGLKDMSPNDKDTFERVWKVVQECGEQERHFNQIQGVYRGLASTWILATLGAVGYLLFNKDMAAIPRFPVNLVAAVICFVGATGATLIWVLDLQVYHKLLVAVFDEGLKLEEEFHWLPRFRINMVGPEGDPLRRRLAFYYLGTVGVPLVAASLFVGLHLSDMIGHWLLCLTMLLAFDAFLLFLLVWSTTRSRGSSVEKRIKTAVKNVVKQHPDTPLRVRGETGSHITKEQGSFVLYSDVRSRGIKFSALTENVDFKWSKKQKDFVTTEGEKLEPKIVELIGLK